MLRREFNFLHQQGTAGDMQHRVMSTLTNRIRFWTFHGESDIVISAHRALTWEKLALLREVIYVNRKRLLQRKESVAATRSHSTPSKHSTTQARITSHNSLSDRALPDHFTPLFPFSHSHTHYLMKYPNQHCSSVFKLSTSLLNSSSIHITYRIH